MIGRSGEATQGSNFVPVQRSPSPFIKGNSEIFIYLGEFLVVFLYPGLNVIVFRCQMAPVKILQGFLHPLKGYVTICGCRDRWGRNYISQ